MHSADELSPEFRYQQSMLAKYRLKGVGGLGPSHLEALDACREKFFSRAAIFPPFLFPFRDLVMLAPDFMMRLAADYLNYLDSPGPPPLFSRLSQSSNSGGGDGGGAGSNDDASDENNSNSNSNSSSSSSSSSSDASPAVKVGMELVSKVLRLAPGMTCAYIEQARAFTAQVSQALRH